MRNRLKARLAAGERLCGAWAQLGSPDAAEALVRAGWDVIVVDCEHGCVGVENAAGMIRAVEAAGGEAILRVPFGDDATLKRALDRGAKSLMVPMVNDAATAASVAAACRYPPLGRRGFARAVRAAGYGTDAGYQKAAADELLLMVQIEHVTAVAEFDAIMATPGVDMGFVGPNDLAGSMGRLNELDCAEMNAAHAEIEAKAAASGALLGTITLPGRGFRELFDLGYRLAIGPCDTALVVAGAAAARAAKDAALEGFKS